MGASLWLRHRGFKATKNPRELGFKSAPKKATISATIAHDFRHNRALIGVDRAPYTPRNAIRSRRNESATNALGSRFDRAAIAARSRLDRTAIIGFFLDLSAPSDGALIVIKKSNASESSTRFHGGRQIAIARSPFDDNPTFFASPRGVR